MNRPSFLLIMSDQHNPHVMGRAGDPHVRTPNLDRLAGAGVQFDRAYCAHPLCVPSRMAFMTGQYPLDLGIWTNAGILPSEVPTFAHVLNAAGYDTVLCGRMHFVGKDQNHGFARRLVGDVSGALEGSPGRDLFEGVWSWKANRQNVDTLAQDAVGPGKATYEIFDEAVTDRACRWLEERAVRSDTDRPFLLVVGFLLPHNPYVCSKPLFEEYMDKLPVPVPREDRDEHPAVRRLKQQRGMDRAVPEQLRRARAAYYGLTTTLDRNVGRLVDALRQTPFQPETHVVYTSDHGELCGEHGLWWKDSFYEGSVRVPLLWAAPNRRGPPRRVRSTVSLLDISATLADLSGGPSLPAGRGRSLGPFLASDTGGIETGWPDEAFAETFTGAPARMLQTGPWKLCVYAGFERVQLFNLENDPEERNDLGLDPDFEDVRRRLLAHLTRDWGPECVSEQHARRMAEQELVCRSGAPRKGQISERWTFPSGGNVRE
ncbi:MAG: sulfatase-like hydrolase/transferase [Kiritimatiellaeota bacterium]|nr:sulfatase-like hydrolase/transferase [Kiritimatiellota bacterium]